MLRMQMGGSVQVRYKIKSSVQLFYHFLAMISHEIDVLNKYLGIRTRLWKKNRVRYGFGTTIMLFTIMIIMVMIMMIRMIMQGQMQWSASRRGSEQ